MNRLPALWLLLPAAVSALASEPPMDCSAAEYRQFDFWIGSYEVRTADGRLAGHNLIEATLNGCALTEHWTSASGGEGRSINFYDRDQRRWQQVWIDHRGRPLRLAGGIVDGAMVLEGTTSGEDGATQLHRIRWAPLAGGNVRQHWQSSADGGEHWTTLFDGLYLRQR